MSDELHRDPTGAQLRVARAPDVSRRRFLMLGAGAASAAAAAPVLAGTSAVVETPAEPSQSQGYQETAHVRTYYATARL